MKITIEPDSNDAVYIWFHSQALNLIKSFLQALGISKADRERWDDVLWAEVDTSSTIEFEGMTCYLPETIKNQQSWKYSTLLFNSNYLLLLNGLPFMAKMTNTNAVDDLPSDLINFSCTNWPFNDLSQSFKKFHLLKSIDLASRDLTNITLLEKLTQLNSLKLRCESLSEITSLTKLTQLNSIDLSGCSSLLDITPLANLTQLNSIDLSGCSSLLDITPLEKLTQLNSLNLSGCSSLLDITPLEKLTQLNSLNLSHCNSLSDITPLGKLIQINSLGLSGCDSLSDITPLEKLTQINSLDLSWCGSLSDITPLEKLVQINSLYLCGCKSLSDIKTLEYLNKLIIIDFSHCNSISNICPIQFFHEIKIINIEECLRLTGFPNFKQLKHLYKLHSSLHPTTVGDILAHCAVSREDWTFIEQNADAWTSELELALKASHPAAFDLATSLAIAFPRISLSFELCERLCQILQTHPSLGYRPWKQLFLGVFQQMGFNLLQNLSSTIAAGSWPRGAIGGLSAIAEQLITLPDGKEWFAGWVRAISAQHESNPSFLKPVAAPWCLALHCLGENALLDQWIARFTDPDDSSALDAVFLEFGNHRLGHNDAPGAFRHAMRIRATLVRDGLLADIASHHLEAQQADQAAELLFLLSAEDKRAELSLKLADIPHFLDNRDNLHRLLAACGKDAPAIGKLLAKAGMASDFNPADRASICSTAAREATRVGAMIAGMTEHETDALQQLLETHLATTLCYN